MPRILKGTITSDKMQKTAVVEVLRLKKHRKYKKYFKVTHKFKVDNPDNQYKTGDKVIMKESSPISKDKRWKIVSKADKS